MSAPVSNHDFSLGGSISRQVADAAKEEVVADAKQAEGKPVTFVTHKVKTRMAANEFLQVSIPSHIQ
ncbi:uncharacterized protein RAG0_17548 [Rhynchosporium agropyri]|uniref:Uncharacterized protein n=2 Tax=Rhynchosporium TaxID=38037 RepID=A0A1E1MUW2_RHYSE|nr:uncharacterized protein RAG0_17548 [Rhynchosporium agropyri]CZT52870.1 uncharacterized protein RSE6_14265 [Rhynchosporium secalis]